MQYSAEYGVHEVDKYVPREAKLPVDDSSCALVRDNNKCILCGACVRACDEHQGLQVLGFANRGSRTVVQPMAGKCLADSECVNCGQCAAVCPTGALTIKSQTEEVWNAINNPDKKVVVQFAPSVRVAVGEMFGLEAGTNSTEQLNAALRAVGFDLVFDTNFSADLTIMEEASELVDRIKNNGKIPMFTSCCPAWVKYAEQFYPEILDNISTCKSPIGMMGMVVQNYFTKIKNIEKEDIFTVAITPCTAKKYEINREEIGGTDLVLTLYELEEHIHEKNIKYEDIKEDSFDPILGEGSGAGVIFGNTGGVMEAALRTAYYLITGNNLEEKDISFHNVRGYNGLREATIKIEDLELKIAIIDGISNAKKVIEEVKNGTSKYHYIEIMNCVGGCIGGGGQPKINIMQEDEIKKNRITNLYKRDDYQKVRFSHENPDIIEIYKDYLTSPLSNLSEELLHTHYIDRSRGNKY